MVDVVAIVLWATVALYFVQRFWRFRKFVSLMLALMAAGWGLFVLDSMMQLSRDLTHWVALFLGALVWYAIVRVELTGR